LCEYGIDVGDNLKDIISCGEINPNGYLTAYITSKNPEIFFTPTTCMDIISCQ
jgi:hypothetical protein